MGSGKTTIGKLLASKLGYPILDIDHEIQDQFKLRISEIWENFGQERFREEEHKWISKTETYTDAVVSTGGGAPCFFNNMDLMNQLGVTIYLKTDPKTLVNRLKSSQHTRPLLKDKSEAELLQYVTATLAEREPFYLKAKHIIQAIDIKVQDIIIILASQ